MFSWLKREKKQYLDCPYLKHSIHFFYDNIRACCVNIPGPVFYDNFEGGDINWDFIYNSRKKIFDNINKNKYPNGYPLECQDCCEKQHFITDLKIKSFENKIKRIYFHNNMSCNAKCTYCTYGWMTKGYKYKVVPMIKSMIEKNILSKDAYVYMSGGEMTIYPEFEELFSILSTYLNSCIEILSSGIKYSDAIKEAFKQNKCRIVISLDSGCRETYLKIKQVDCFDSVVNNIKSYISYTDNAKDRIVLKYIIVDNANDNKDEIEKFINLVVSLGVKNVRLDIDYEKYKYAMHKKVPTHYFELYDYFHKLANDNNLKIEICEQSEDIIKYSRNQI